MMVFDAIWPATSKGPWLRDEMMVVCSPQLNGSSFVWNAITDRATGPKSTDVMWHMTHRWVGRWVGGCQRAGGWVIGRLSPFGSCRGIDTKNRETIGERDRQRGWPGVTRTTHHSNWSGATLTHTSCVHFGCRSERGVSGWNGRRHGNGVPEHHGVAWDTSGAGLTLVQPTDCFFPHLTRFGSNKKQLCAICWQHQSPEQLTTRGKCETHTIRYVSAIFDTTTSTTPPPTSPDWHLFDPHDSPTARQDPVVFFDLPGRPLTFGSLSSNQDIFWPETFHSTNSILC